jgi:REP element-mobilizing transposase RayT
MSYDPNIHHRRSIRLRTWDYSWPWWYFVTVVVKDRLCVLGDVQVGGVVLSHLGAAVDDCWRKMPQHHAGVELDDHVVMPNHVHGIIIITSNNDGRDVQLNVPTEGATKLFSSRRDAMRSLSPRKESLSVIVRTFKAAVTIWARKNGFEDFAWQSRFHDHIIRNEADLYRIRTYIANNPLQWALDEENPGNRK